MRGAFFVLDFFCPFGRFRGIFSSGVDFLLFIFCYFCLRGISRWQLVLVSPRSKEGNE